ncbi:MAG: class I SAM-dependent methyltransferase [Brasilonema sp.]
MLAKRFERLNALAKINSASRYLEIGVAQGVTFTQIDVSYKIAVDPKFKFNFQEYADQKTIFYEVRSDLFFSKFASEHDEFDLIYLDGLHTFEQTFRDFCASLKNSHKHTIWLIDDTHPSSWLAANPNPKFVKRLRKYLNIKDRRWMGDVFKVVFAIHDFFPQFSYATFPGHGQTVVWLENRDNFTPTWNSLEKISRLGYRDFLKFRDSHLLVLEPSKILESLEKSIKAK